MVYWIYKNPLTINAGQEIWEVYDDNDCQILWETAATITRWYGGA